MPIKNRQKHLFTRGRRSRASGGSDWLTSSHVDGSSAHATWPLHSLEYLSPGDISRGPASDLATVAISWAANCGLAYLADSQIFTRAGGHLTIWIRWHMPAPAVTVCYIPEAAGWSTTDVLASTRHQWSTVVISCPTLPRRTIPACINMALI